LEAKERDKGTKSVRNVTKVRAAVECDSCGAPRCVFSMYVLGTDNGPRQDQFVGLEQWMDSGGFVCGNRIEGNMFVIREQMRCGENVEVAYYSNDATRGSRILTTDVCAICYNTEDVILVGEIKKRKNLQGKNPLPIFRACLDLNVPIPQTKGSRTNSQEKVAQTPAKKRPRLRASVENKRRKGRKAAV
jgi:hypothetical protein